MSLKQVLPPSHAAGPVASKEKESEVPSDWPGTHCPNFSDWALGDVVLVHATDDLMGRSMTAAQAISTIPLIRANAHVTHAALYVGSGQVIDATIGQPISIRSVWPYCQAREIQVRRMTHPELPINFGLDLLLAANTHLGEAYSSLSVLISKLIPATLPDPEALYCSTFVSLVVTEATGLLLEGYAGCAPLHPATIAAHPVFQSVGLEWRSL